jgi:ssDNA-binding Zn-finger/Zn-ribbon topoisomerase 1
MALLIGQEVSVHCPECGYDTLLVVRVNRWGRLFLGCPNYEPGTVALIPAQAACTHTQAIPTDIYMAACGQPMLPINMEES